MKRERERERKQNLEEIEERKRGRGERKKIFRKHLILIADTLLPLSLKFITIIFTSLDYSD